MKHRAMTTPTQLPLYDPAAAIAAANSAIEQVAEHTDEDWAAQALQAVERVCILQDEFLVDDVWQEFERLVGDFAETGTHERRAMGAVMRQAMTRGWCRRTTRYKASSRVTCHRNPRVIWQSLVKV